MHGLVHNTHYWGIVDIPYPGRQLESQIVPLKVNVVLQEEHVELEEEVQLRQAPLQG